MTSSISWLFICHLLLHEGRNLPLVSEQVSIKAGFTDTDLTDDLISLFYSTE